MGIRNASGALIVNDGKITEYKGNENIEQLESFLKTSFQSGLDLALLKIFFIRRSQWT